MRGTLIVCAELESLSREAARCVLAAIEASGRRPFRLALAGGSTPRRLYELLASPPFAHRIPWDHLHVFWGDERLVPHDHPQSNYRMARESLLRHVPLPPKNIHGVPLLASAEESALAYEQELRSHFGRRWGLPAFDLILLGLGADGHTASLFPRSPALEEKQRWVVAARAGAGQPPRVTLTLPVLNHTRRIFFLVSGEDKATALREALEGTLGHLPAQKVAPRKGELVWLADAAAASRLKHVRVLAVAEAEP
ncbi:MAG: 6-phosphogluconolactonase [Acidobacteria bacterium]|nr:6-phosphogluconolactonase [Acidobacteriota bacterium]